MIRKIPLNKVKPGMITADNVFTTRDHSQMVPRNTILTELMIDRFACHGVTHVLVNINDKFWRELVQDEIIPIKRNARTIINKKNIRVKPFNKKTTQDKQTIAEIEPVTGQELRDEAVSSIRRMFDAVSDGTENMTTAYQVIKEVDAVVDQLVDSLAAESDSLVHIVGLKSYDEYTYHHSVSVAVLSIAIGQSLGFSKEQLKMLGRCAIMHDIGKVLVPVEIINKPGKLDSMEFSVVQQHPKNGYDYLKKGNIGNEVIRQGILLHHEKIDGTGYPLGLKDKQVPLFSRIVSTADVYDAVTSYRPYRKPMSPADAVEFIMSEVGRSFDFEIVEAFLSKLELYPINSCVELSDSRRGTVIDNTYSMRPILRMLDTGETLDLMDLDNLSLVITSLLDQERAGFASKN